MSIVQDIRSAFTRRDNALNQLILLNVLVYAVIIIINAILKISSQSEYISLVALQFELSSSLPVLLRHPWTIFTYGFTHKEFLHIFFNMLNLYWFGQLIREYLGDRRLVSLYVLGALAGAAIFLLSFNSLQAFKGGQAETAMLGASAAVTAIIVAAATLLPDYTFSLILIGPVKIKWIAAVVVILSFAGVNSGNAGGNIAHLGGAALGFIFIKQLQAGRDLGTPVQGIGNWFRNLFSQAPPMRASTTTSRAQPVAVASSAGAKKTTSTSSQEEVDIILDKISRSGYESLSKDEKQKLFKASQD